MFEPNQGKQGGTAKNTRQAIASEGFPCRPAGMDGCLSVREAIARYCLTSPIRQPINVEKKNMIHFLTTPEKENTNERVITKALYLLLLCSEIGIIISHVCLLCQSIQAKRASGLTPGYALFTLLNCNLQNTAIRQHCCHSHQHVHLFEDFLAFRPMAGEVELFFYLYRFLFW